MAASLFYYVGDIQVPQDGYGIKYRFIVFGSSNSGSTREVTKWTILESDDSLCSECYISPPLKITYTIYNISWLSRDLFMLLHIQLNVKYDVMQYCSISG